MFFYSLEFVLIFLPLVVAGYFVSYRLWKTNGVALFLALGSLVYYAFWGASFFLLLLISLAANYLFHRAIHARLEIWSDKAVSRLLVLAIIFNVLWLAYFKYQGFFYESLIGVGGEGGEVARLMLPVGISFYTFIQIGFLIDVRNGMLNWAGPLPLSRFITFGSFFPYVTAGPLVLQDEILRQISTDNIRPNANRCILGLSVFVIGLAKKLVLADTLAPQVAEFFTAVEFRENIGAIQAWIGMSAYMIQLYFDFSGYSDMALGLGIIFGVLLPLNFNSPLKAANIVDFWRRWHMTMSRFFTNYLYTPLAMSLTRRGILQGYSPRKRMMLCVVFPTVLTFLIAGVWHGAGWGFVIFGLIHGFALSINHYWNTQKSKALPYILGWSLTILVFLLSLVFFRSPNVSDAMFILTKMSFLGGGGGGGVPMIDLVYLFAGFVIALYAPNTLSIFNGNKISSDELQSDRSSAILIWSPTAAWTVGLAFLAVLSLSFDVRETPFIYYKF